jgi:hypothetical protein
MFGACILVVGLIRMTVRSRLLQTVLLGALVGLAVGFHFRNADSFRKHWSTQKSLYWQLSWRAPGLKPGTSLLLDATPSLFVPLDYFLAAPVNFLYAPRHASPRLDYSAFVLSKDKDLGRDVPQLTDGVPLKQSFFSLSFDGSTSDSLVVWFSPPSCLRVLDPRRDEIPLLSPEARAARLISHMDRILTNPDSPARPPAEIFGPAPGPCWCYYFEKADLARQTGDWQGVARAGDEARRLGLEPEDPAEWLLFVEGYAQVGRYQEAREAAECALRAISVRPEAAAARSPTENELAVLARPAMCGLLERLEGDGLPDAPRRALIADIDAQLSCSPDSEVKAKEQHDR